ncbi:MAG: DUF1109 family protein [Rhizobiales bacterium]|nr:DUF1109 family protein [Hyphomicrobiales bacterium]
MNTDDLIRQLSGANAPVRPLRPPWARALLWLVLAVPYVALVILLHPHTPEVAESMTDLRLVIEILAALATGVTAAWAAFASTVPGADRRILWLPVLPGSVWAATLGAGCLDDWLQYGAEALALRPDWDCLPPAILVGTLPLISILVMLRRGAPLRPRLSVLLAALAVAGLGNAGMRLFHPGDATIMILIWHVGVAFALTALAGLAGKAVLSWRQAWARVQPRGYA